jgi:hypothetical protein
MSRNNNDPFGFRNDVDYNAAAIAKYVKEGRSRANNPKKWSNLFTKHAKAGSVAFNTRKKYELEKNAAKKEALLENVKRANAEYNSLANALNANANADYPYLEEYERMINRGEVEPVLSMNYLKGQLALQKKWSKERALRSNSSRKNAIKRAAEEATWASSSAGGGSSRRRKTRKSRKNKTRKSRR